MEFENIDNLNEEQILKLFYDVLEGNPESISYDAICEDAYGYRASSSAYCK